MAPLPLPATVEARPVAAVSAEDDDEDEEDDDDRAAAAPAAAAAPPVIVVVVVVAVEADAEAEAEVDAVGVFHAEEKVTGKTTTVPAAEQLATASPLSSMLMPVTAAAAAFA